jgi:hypothetical protein
MKPTPRLPALARALAIIATSLWTTAAFAQAQPDPSQPDQTDPNAPAKAIPKSKKKAADPAPAASDPNNPGTPGQPGSPAKPAAPGQPGAKPAAPAAPPAPSGPTTIVPRGPGPWDNDLLIAHLPAGDPMKGPSMGFSAPADTKVFDRGGVACLCRDAKGRLLAAYQWFPQLNSAAFDKIAIRTSSDEAKTWSAPKTVTVAGLPDGAARPCDPTLVTLDDGRLRLYFTSHLKGEPAATFSAISSADEITVFTFEPGVRFRDSGNDVLDCAVTKLGQTWHYFAPVQKPDAQGRVLAYHATSKDGLTFETQKPLTLDTPGKGDAAHSAAHHRWLGCAVTSSDGKTLRFFGTLDNAGLWTAHSSTGNDWKLEDIGLKTGADPAAVDLKDGSLLVIVTGPPRPGTPSAKKPAPPKP